MQNNNILNNFLQAARTGNVDNVARIVDTVNADQNKGNKNLTYLQIGSQKKLGMGIFQCILTQGKEITDKIATIKNKEKPLFKDDNDLLETLEKQQQNNLKILNITLKLKNSDTLLNQDDISRTSPIHLAIEIDASNKEKKTPYLDLLLENRANLTQKTSKDTINHNIWHTLCLSNEENAEKCFDRLIEETQVKHPSNDKLKQHKSILYQMREVDTKGNNAFHIAAQNKNTKHLQYMQKLVEIEVKTKNKEELKNLLAESLVSATNLENASPLTLAIKNGNQETLKLILQNKEAQQIIQENTTKQQEVIDECILSENFGALTLVSQSIVMSNIKTTDVYIDEQIEQSKNQIQEYEDEIVKLRKDLQNTQEELNQFGDINTTSFISKEEPKKLILQGRFKNIEDKLLIKTQLLEDKKKSLQECQEAQSLLKMEIEEQKNKALETFYNKHLQDGRENEDIIEQLANHKTTKILNDLLRLHPDQSDRLRNKIAEAAARISQPYMFGEMVEGLEEQINQDVKAAALRSGNHKILEKIKDKYGRLEIITKEGNNELHLIAQSGNTDGLQILGEYNPEKITEKNKKGYTPIEVSIRSNPNDLKMLNEMLEAKKAWDTSDNEDAVKIALKESALTGNIKALQLLTEKHGASIYQMFGTESLIEIAANGENPKKVVQYIIAKHKELKATEQDKNHSNTQEMEKAIRRLILESPPHNGDEELDQILLTEINQEDIDNCINQGIHPLNRAIANNRLYLAQQLDAISPELKDRTVQNPKSHIDLQKTTLTARNSKNPKFISLFSGKKYLEAATLADLPEKEEKSGQTTHKQKTEEQKENKKSKHDFIALKDQDIDTAGQLTGYINAIIADPSSKQLKKQLDADKEDSKKLLTGKYTISGHSLPTFVAAYGTVEQWKEVNKQWKKIGSTKTPEDHMCNLKGSELGTPLEVAIKAENTNVTSYLIEELKKDKKTLQQAAKTALETGNTELLQKILEKNKKIDPMELLKTAIETENFTATTYLVDCINKLSLPEKDVLIKFKQHKLLHSAVLQKNIAFLNSILELVKTLKNAQFISLQDDKKNTVLDLAVKNNNVPAIRKLLDELDKTIKDVQMPKNVVEAAKECRIKAFEKAAKTPKCNLETLQVFINTIDSLSYEQQNNLEFLKEVAKTGNAQVLDYLIEHNNLNEEQKQNLLHSACKAGNTENIDLLIKENPELLVQLGENNTSFLDALIAKPEISEWCCNYLSHNCALEAVKEVALAQALKLGDPTTLKEVIKQDRILKGLFIEQNGKLIIETVKNADMVAILAESMLRSDIPMTDDQLIKVYNILNNNGYCINNDYYSRLLANAAGKKNTAPVGMFQKATKDNNYQLAEVLLCKKHHDAKTTIDLFKEAVQSKNLEIIKLILQELNSQYNNTLPNEVTDFLFSGQPCELENIALAGEQELYKELTQDKMLQEALEKNRLANQEEELRWLNNYAKGGFTHEFRNGLNYITLEPDIHLNQEKKIQIEKEIGKELLTSLLTGGNATQEMMEIYKNKFPHYYADQLTLAQRKNTNQNDISNIWERYQKVHSLAEEKTIRWKNFKSFFSTNKDENTEIPLWMEALASGKNIELARYLYNEEHEALEKDSNLTKGELNRRALSHAENFSQMLTYLGLEELDQAAEFLEDIRQTKHQPTKGYQIITNEYIERSEKQTILKEYIKQNILIPQDDIKNGNLDLYDPLIGKTLTDHLLEEGSTDTKLHMLQHCPKPWIADIHGNTRLHTLLKQADEYNPQDLLYITKILISNGANPNATNNEGKTPLQMLDDKPEYLNLAQYLKQEQDNINQKEADIKAKAGNNTHRLRDEIRFYSNPYSHVLSAFIKCISSDIIGDGAKNKPIENALRNAINDLEPLLNGEKNYLSCTDAQGNNILHTFFYLAVNNNNNGVLIADAVTQILSKVKQSKHFSIDLLSAQNCQGETPLDILARGPYLLSAFKALEYEVGIKSGIRPDDMIKKVDLNHVFREAAAHNNQALCEYLLYDGPYGNIDINTSDAESESALFKALRNNQSKMFNYLLEAGANIDQINDKNETLLHVIMYRINSGQDKNLEQDILMANALINGGASLTYKDKHGNSVVDIIRNTQQEAQKKVGTDANKNYLEVCKNLVNAATKAQSELISDEKKLNHTIKESIHLHNKIQTFGEKIGGTITGIRSGYKKESTKDDFSAHILGKVLELELYSNSYISSPGLFKHDTMQKRNINTCIARSDGYTTRVQKIGDKRIYTVEKGEMCLTVQGINNEPTKLVVIVNADGTIKAESGEWKEHQKGLRNVQIGGRSLYEALQSGQWKHIIDQRQISQGSEKGIKQQQNPNVPQTQRTQPNQKQSGHLPQNNDKGISPAAYKETGLNNISNISEVREHNLSFREENIDHNNDSANPSQTGLNIELDKEDEKKQIDLEEYKVDSITRDPEQELTKQEFSDSRSDYSRALQNNQNGPKNIKSLSSDYLQRKVQHDTEEYMQSQSPNKQKGLLISGNKEEIPTIQSSSESTKIENRKEMEKSIDDDRTTKVAQNPSIELEKHIDSKSLYLEKELTESYNKTSGNKSPSKSTDFTNKTLQDFQNENTELLIKLRNASKDQRNENEELSTEEELKNKLLQHIRNFQERSGLKSLKEKPGLTDKERSYLIDKYIKEQIIKYQNSNTKKEKQQKSDQEPTNKRTNLDEKKPTNTKESTGNKERDLVQINSDTTPNINQQHHQSTGSRLLKPKQTPYATDFVQRNIQSVSQNKQKDLQNTSFDEAKKNLRAKTQKNPNNSKNDNKRDPFKTREDYSAIIKNLKKVTQQPQSESALQINENEAATLYKKTRENLKTIPKKQKTSFQANEDEFVQKLQKKVKSRLPQEKKHSENSPEINQKRASSTSSHVVKPKQTKPTRNYVEENIKKVSQKKQNSNNLIGVSNITREKYRKEINPKTTAKGNNVAKLSKQFEAIATEQAKGKTIIKNTSINSREVLEAPKNNDRTPTVEDIKQEAQNNTQRDRQEWRESQKQSKTNKAEDNSKRSFHSLSEGTRFAQMEEKMPETQKNKQQVKPIKLSHNIKQQARNIMQEKDTFTQQKGQGIIANTNTIDNPIGSLSNDNKNKEHNNQTNSR